MQTHKVNDLENSQSPSSSNTTKIRSPQQQKGALRISLIFWIYYMLFTTYVALILYFIANTNNQTLQMAKSDYYYYGNQVAYSWTQGYINNLQVTNTGTCPQGYTYGFSFNWPGSNYGCYCGINSNISFALPGYCTPSLIQEQCSNVAAVNSTKANNWNNYSTLCVQRSSVSFATEPTPSNSTKVCGSSNSLVIIPNSQPCPFVNISYVPFALQNNIVTIASNILPNIYAVFNSTSPFSFYSYPIYQFKVSEYQFCLIDTDTGINPNHSDYILLKNYRGCAQPGNFTVLDTLNQSQFYSFNAALSSLTTLKGFPTPGNWQYNLGFTSMPSWSYKCRFNYGKSYNIANARIIFNFNYKTIHDQFSIGMYICLSILASELVVLFLRRIFKTEIYPAGFKKIYLPRQFMVGVARIVLQVILKTLVLVFSIYFCYLSYFNWHWIINVLNYNCSDSNPQLINYVLLPYQQMYNSLYIKFLTMVCICIVMMVLDCFYYFYIYKSQLQFYIQKALEMKFINETKIQQNEKQVIFDDKNLDLGIEIKVDQDEQFKKTMAKDFYDANKEIATKPQKKKKKKKILRKKDDKKDGLVIDPINADFNPYEMDNIMPAESNEKLNEDNNEVGIGIKTPNKQNRNKK